MSVAPVEHFVVTLYAGLDLDYPGLRPDLRDPGREVLERRTFDTQREALLHADVTLREPGWSRQTSSALLLARHYSERRLLEVTVELKPKVICAWCGELLREGSEPISHGICLPCKGRWSRVSVPGGVEGGLGGSDG